jgi:methionyl-tRNA synthetase|tara:strand:- start:105 stop:425 length:321 start_codon:yes stop_codon:yes gene_type:complete
MEIDQTDLKALNLRVGEIIDAKKVEGSNKLIRIMVDIGEKRQAVAGLREWYNPEDMIGKKVVFLANLKPIKLFGIESQGMILAAEDEKGVSILTVNRKVKNGMRIK